MNVSFNRDTLHEIRGQLENPDTMTDLQWRTVFRWLNFEKDYDRDISRNLLIRILENDKYVPGKYYQILQRYIEVYGLFPYLDTSCKSIGVREALRYEFHRSENMPEVVMHEEQTEVISLLARQSVILSAPTSFGKSLLIDEIVSSNMFDNITIIVPTIALIDETRIRLDKFRNLYKLIFTTRQSFAGRNIMILTPERFLELQTNPTVDFFVIDEFYKVGEKDDRAAALNQAFYKLSKMTKSFYLLGPNISSIPQGFEEDYSCKFKRTGFSTVATEETVIRVMPGEELSELLKLLLSLNEPTMVYCQSPASAEKCTKALLQKYHEEGVPKSHYHIDAINWIAQNVHSDWTLASAFEYGIAFHHGAMPRHLGRYVVNAFNAGEINFLFCTSTLIEGVNTSARNVVIFDGKKSKKALTYFDYKNICGRAGRMKRYYMGKVFTFHNPPKEEDVDVDFPWYTQTDATDEILIQIDDEDLKSYAKERMREYYSNSFLSLDVIRKNYGVPVAGQLALAEEILSDLNSFHQMLSWSGYPTREQLLTVCDLMWRHLVTRKEGIFSARQLNFHIRTYWDYGKNLPTYINFILNTDRNVTTVDEAVQKAMNLVKKWFEFQFPKLLSALERIQAEVFEANALVPGEYGYFGSQIEYGFCTPTLADLQEFGMPLSLLRKLEPHLRNLDEIDVDTVLTQVRSLDLSYLHLHPYERKLLNQLIVSSRD